MARRAFRFGVRASRTVSAAWTQPTAFAPNIAHRQTLAAGYTAVLKEGDARRIRSQAGGPSRGVLYLASPASYRTSSVKSGRSEAPTIPSVTSDAIIWLLAGGRMVGRSTLMVHAAAVCGARQFGGGLEHSPPHASAVSDLVPVRKPRGK